MDNLRQIELDTPQGKKQLAVLCGDISDLSEELDVLTISAFHRDYAAVPHTLLGALDQNDINTALLSAEPFIDLRTTANIWLSPEIETARLPIRRIGCIESPPLFSSGDRTAILLKEIQAYFHMLEIASLSGVPIRTLAMPVIGGGNQHIDSELVMIPILNECLRFLKQDEQIRRIFIITRNRGQAEAFAATLEQSYHLMQNRQPAEEEKKQLAFISYSSADRNVADNLCAKLEARGIPVWYAPRNIHSKDYASAIVQAISECSHFVVILSKHSLASEHVLNEIDLAFQELNRKIAFLPLKIDEEELGPAFKYYLSRQHWMDAHVPPLEKRLEEFVSQSFPIN